MLPVVHQPRLGLAVDFDGTVSEIVPVPDDARITPGCAEALDRLSHRLAVVAVVSGRSVHELQSKVALEDVVYVGNHGAEFAERGRVTVAPGAAETRAKVIALFERLKAAADIPGLIWQDKGYSASVHYRLAPDPDEAAAALSRLLEPAPLPEGVEVFWGKRVLELRPAAGWDKGYAVRSLAQRWRLSGLVFVGDDMTDVDGLRALKGLKAEGPLQGLGVAVVYDDSPRDLMQLADYGLSGVAGVEAFLRWLDSVTE